MTILDFKKIMSSHLLRRILFVLTVILLGGGLSSGCTQSQPPSPTAQATGTAPEILGIEVIPSGLPPEREVLSREKIPQNNCGGTGTTTNSIERSRTIVYTMEIGAGISVNAEGKAGVPGVGEVSIGTEVAAQYGLSYGISEQFSRSITISAGPETFVEHQLELVSYWEIGEVILNLGNGGKISYPYRFQRDFGIEQIGSSEISCALTPTIQAAQTTPSSPTNLNNPNTTTVATITPQTSISTSQQPTANTFFGGVTRLIPTNPVSIIALAILGSVLLVLYGWLKNQPLLSKNDVVYNISFYSFTIFSGLALLIIAFGMILGGILWDSTFMYLLCAVIVSIIYGGGGVILRFINSDTLDLFSVGPMIIVYLWIALIFFMVVFRLIVWM